MGKCTRCGKSGIFLKLNDGVCENNLVNAIIRGLIGVGSFFGSFICFAMICGIIWEDSETIPGIVAIIAFFASIVVSTIIVHYYKKHSANINSPESTDTSEPIQEVETASTLHRKAQNVKEIEDIPSSAGDLNLNGAFFHDYKSDIDYQLRREGFEYEKEGKIDLAIACLRKSNEIRMHARKGYKIEDYYSLVYMLASHGFKDEAQAEKKKIDDFFSAFDTNNDSFLCDKNIIINRVVKEARNSGTDLVIMSVHSAACPECAKYQGRVFSISGRNNKYPKIPDAFWKYGGIHAGCGHGFYPFIDGVSDGDLKYTLSIQKINNPRYTASIVAYSNRPFIDDRPKEEILKYYQHEAKKRQSEEEMRVARENMIENAYFHSQEKKKYKLIQDNLPDLCPKSYAGFRRMKVNNTKNYQKLVEEARKIGLCIE